jgi:hypothetical protein
VARWRFSCVPVHPGLEVDFAAGVPHSGIAARTFIIFLVAFGLGFSKPNQ